MGMCLQIQSIAQTQGHQVLGTQLAVKVSADLVSKLGYPLLHQGLVKFIVLIHALQCPPFRYSPSTLALQKSKSPANPVVCRPIYLVG